jgi:glutamate synthase domain-containing protein 2
MTLLVIFLAFVVLLALLAIQDLSQKAHTIRRNFPIIGRFRYGAEAIRPEIHQYFVEGNTDGRPFSHNQRRAVYAASKLQNDQFGFGTDDNIEAPNHVLIKQSAFPLLAPEPGEVTGPPRWDLACAKVLGASHNRPKAFRPPSLANISGMSFGSLSGKAVESLNRGALIAGCMHNTGEGGYSIHHDHGADVIFQIGTGYFGACSEPGVFSMDRLVERVREHPQIKAIEIKFSQGAKPGMGGVLPAEKVTQEIADARGVPVGKTCKSPNSHSEFSDVPQMVDFIERIAAATGLPVGIKSAVGELDFWQELANEMLARPGQGPDFITVDGGEGGTGAAPLPYTDHVSLPFMVGFPRVYRLFAKAGLQHDIVWIGSGMLGFADRALTAMALGCDMINVGREAMMSIGCIQAQRCHTNNCPTGIATHKKRLVFGLDPTLKSARCANYILSLRRDLLSLSRTCGVRHPALVGADRLEIMREHLQSITLREAFEYEDGWGNPSAQQQTELMELLADISLQKPADSFRH